ncbi:MAG: D-alanyl-D-alanine carboxypeptidase/D-alanyl-D-alanine-endopeptidase [Planctomycetota bacterium]
MGGCSWWVMTVVVLATGRSAAFAQDRAAQVRCADLIRTAEGAGLRVGLFAREVDSGRVLAEHRAAEGFVPASNQKLLTVAAALAELGADYRFRTGFTLTHGELRVLAGGDPNWITGGEHDPRALLRAVADQLSRAGVHAIRGIHLDDGRFGGVARPDGWPRDQSHLDYCAPSAGLLLDGACWGVEIRSAGEGEAAEASLVAPWTGFALDGTLIGTRDAKKGGRYRVEEAGTSLRLSGNFWTRGQPRIVRGSCADPTALFERALRAALEEAGIGVDPDAPERDLALETVTTPLVESIERALRESSNIDAEQILRVLGAERGGDGSYAAAPHALRAALAKLVHELPEQLEIVDGSGLSRLDRVTPRLCVDVLDAIARTPHAKLFASALPIAGRDGTLERRFRGSDLQGRVRAKTGTLAGASALSGYLATEDRRVVLFSILVDRSGAKRGAPDARKLEEDIVEVLDGASR